MEAKKTTLLAFGMVLILGLRCADAENIDPCDDGSQFAWGENIGWVNFEPNRPEANVGATVTDHDVTGFIWSENVGWINLFPSYGGVSNDGQGRLSGYAWGENVGWIDFDPNVPNDVNCYGVTIDSKGNFDGWAWGENIGWIRMQASTPVPFKVQSSWTGDPSLGTCWDVCKCAGQPYGDATCDGDVGVINLADLFALKAHFGKCAPWLGSDCCADFTQDGCINLADLFVLKRNFGTSDYSPSTGNQTCPP
jgi:hypothetical protein